jgi:sugar diacid utilization regulator
MILRDLIDHPDLGLSLVYGEHALDRPVGSVFTTDLRDPRRYLTGNPLVLTGLMWRREPADSDEFVRALAESGVVAVAAGEAAFGTIPPDVVDACRQHQVALVRVPVEVSFGQISDLVTAAHEAERGRLLATALGRQHRLLTAIAEGRSLDQLLAQVAADTDVGCRVLTPTGRLVGAAATALAPADVDLVAGTFLRAGRLPAAVELSDGSVASVVAVDSRLDQRLTGWFLVCDGHHQAWPDEVSVTVGELATIISVEHHRWDEGRRSMRRIADEIVALVAGGRSASAEVGVRLADLGADADSPRLVAATAPVDADRVDVIHAVLHDAAGQVDSRTVTGVRDGRVVTLIRATAGDSASVDVLRDALLRLGPGVGAHHLAVGVSTPAHRAALSGALDEAVHASRLADLHGGPVAVVAGDEVDSHVILLATVPDDVRRTFAVGVLGPVLDYDARHGGDLLPTVQAFLELDGSWRRCAETLHVHVNTVRYRVRRVEELTGRDLSRLDDRVDVFLALHSLGPAAD